MKGRLREDAVLRILLLLMPFFVCLNNMMWKSIPIYIVILVVALLLVNVIYLKEIRDPKEEHPKRKKVNLIVVNVLIIGTLIFIIFMMWGK